MLLDVFETHTTRTIRNVAGCHQNKEKQERMEVGMQDRQRCQTMTY